MTRPRLALAGALSAVLLLASCTSEADGADDLRRKAEDVTEPAAPAFEKYVALGDSFTAGPLVPTTSSAGGCFRSDSNYPAILAEQLDVPEVVDVSCSGATTRDLTRPQSVFNGSTVPPQIAAVDAETDLVTIGIGGNDFDLFHTLVSTCTKLGLADPTGAPCAEELSEEDLLERTDRISTRITESVQRVRAKAPEATVVLVGYPRLTPDSGRCEQLPFARGDYAFGARVTRELNRAIEEAARSTDAEFVDMHAASKGHDICSEEPWVNGHQTAQDAALAYHPFADGMEAAADEVLEALGQ